MESFAAGEADVLVATSVIEVGIDVPNATVMLIEAAERYGLSQLHQLRGRVGRGEHASLCILFGDPSCRGWRRWPTSATASGSPRSTWSCAAPARCSARASTACPSSRWRGCPRTRAARAGARPRRPDHGRGPAPRAAGARAAARGGRGTLRLRARPDSGMSEIVRVLDRGYTLIWREDRLEDALSGSTTTSSGWCRIIPRGPCGMVRPASSSSSGSGASRGTSSSSIGRSSRSGQTAGSRASTCAAADGSGVPTEMRFFQLWTFRDGRAVRMELYWDLDEARRGRPSVDP